MISRQEFAPNVIRPQWLGLPSSIDAGCSLVAERAVNPESSGNYVAPCRRYRRIVLISSTLLTETRPESFPRHFGASTRDFPDLLSNSVQLDKTLVEKIRALKYEELVDPEAVEDARAALDQAARFVERELPDAQAFATLSDEGLVTLRWQKGGEGMLLIFAGDGLGTYAIREHGGAYGTNYREFDLKDPLPVAARDAIVRVARS